MNFLILAIILTITLVIIFLFFRAYQIFFDNFCDGISVIRKGKIFYCNNTLVKLFKYKSKKEFLSIHPLQLSPAFQPDGKFSIDKSQAMIEEAQEKGSVVFDWVFLDSTGNENWIEINIFKIDSKLLKNTLFMVWKDINKRIHVQNQLQDLNTNLSEIVENKTKENQEKERLIFFQSRQAQMGEMISMIAHQWRQPLTAISTTAIDMKLKIHFKKLQSLPPSCESILNEFDKELEDIEEYTQILTQTINDFRDYYKPQKEFVIKEINECILKSINIIKGSLRNSNIKLDLNLKSKENIKYYENEMIQVILNLLKNSQDNYEIFDSDEKIISIKSFDTDEFVKIEYKDNGKGIPKNIIEKIFEPYFSTKEKKNGTGLGLYMCLKIMQEHHNGNIEVIPQKKGVFFKITLPKEGNNG